MRPTPLTTRKAGVALAALMLSATLAACQPQTSAAGAATPTSVPAPTDQTSTAAGESTDGSTGGSTGGSTASTTGASDSRTSAPQGLESFYSQTIDWQDCSDGTSPFQCGTVTVPLDWAQSLTDQLNNGHLLTVEGYGHITFGSNTCATAAMTDFLVNGTVPAEGTTCATEPQPTADGGTGN